MPDKNDNIFSSKLSLVFSKHGLILLLTTVFLTVFLIFSTYENINRARIVMESFLVKKGETVIKSIEASIRAGIMHQSSIDSIHTLITENGKENDVVFITIINRQGVELYSSQNVPSHLLSPNNISQLFGNDQIYSNIDEQTGIFTIAQKLNIRSPLLPLVTSSHVSQKNSPSLKDIFSESVICIGMLTEEYDNARLQDVHHALFMGILLFLVGGAGLYTMFMYQGMRIAQTTLENVKLYTDNVIESIPVGLVTLDIDDNIISFNKKAEEILDQSLETLKGKNIKKIVSFSGFDGSQANQYVFDYSTKCKIATGKQIPIKLNGSSLLNGDGEKFGSVLIIQDMTQIKSMEQQLELSRRMAALGKMAAGIAHEIRNPLGTLRGFSQFFGNQAGASQESKTYSDLMVSEVDRLNDTVSGLLQFSRPRQPQFSLIILKDLFHKLDSLMSGDFLNKNIQFNWSLSSDITLMVDDDLLLQVLMNLLQNSIAASPSGGKISLKAEEVQESHIKITVYDSGEIISSLVQEKMFDPFFTTKKTGSGLGLAVSHQIIEQHNGKFEVTSSYKNGTEISVILPKSNFKDS
ncbi:MAG: ATP-binding protein [Desulfotalea sp.]